MRIPLIAGNWKMNTTVTEAEKLASLMRDRLDKVEGVEKVLCPPFISLTTVGKVLQGSSVKLGAQNMYFEARGAYTGEISPLMLKELVEFVILGHSERRLYFGETDGLINKKIKTALDFGLKPILCVGEKLEENEGGKMEEVITGQLEGSLANIKPTIDLVIAYEPIWAIGTGRAANGITAANTIKFIRHILANLWNSEVAQEVRILYGGSVTGSNIAEFISQLEIDGALVGGASLKFDEFTGIVTQSSTIKGRKPGVS
jgi:triosephosphate isomerase